MQTLALLALAVVIAVVALLIFANVMFSAHQLVPCPPLPLYVSPLVQSGEGRPHDEVVFYSSLWTCSQSFPLPCRSATHPALAAARLGLPSLLASSQHELSRQARRRLKADDDFFDIYLSRRYLVSVT